MDEIVELMAKAQHDDCVQGDHEWGERADVQDYWRQSVRAALSALHDAGWRVVPEDPTTEAIFAIATSAYSAMIDASPVKKG